MRAFHHLAIQVRDLRSMERFYRELFELPVLQRWPDGRGGERSVWLGLEQGFLALEVALDGVGEEAPLPSDAPLAAARPGLHLFAMRIGRSERQTWEARLARAGVTIERRSPFSLFFRDPEGNRLAVSHHPEPLEG